MQSDKGIFILPHAYETSHAWIGPMRLMISGLNGMGPNRLTSPPEVLPEDHL